MGQKLVALGQKYHDILTIFEPIAKRRARKADRFSTKRRFADFFRVATRFVLSADRVTSIFAQ